MLLVAPVVPVVPMDTVSGADWVDPLMPAPFPIPGCVLPVVPLVAPCSALFGDIPEAADPCVPFGEDPGISLPLVSLVR